MGALYKRGTIWWIKYYANGRPVRESTGTDKEKEAERILKQKEGRVAAGLPVLPRVDRITYDEAKQDLLQYYAASGSRDLTEAGFRLSHLDRVFGGWRLAAIGGAEMTAYAVARQRAGAANGTINRELATLSRLLRLAYEQNKLVRLPVVCRLKEAAPRQGFFEQEHFRTVRQALPEDLQVAVTLFYAFGWRLNEVMALERRQLDLDAGTIRLDPGTTKNDEGRVIALPPDLRRLLAEQVARVEALQRRLGRIVPLLFPKLTGRRAGAPRGDWRKRWATACRKAGVPGRLRHDFRRTAVRNMVNAGVPERVAMTMTGHKTRSVFDRYHIVSLVDLQDVARRLTNSLDA